MSDQPYPGSDPSSASSQRGEADSHRVFMETTPEAVAAAATDQPVRLGRYRLTAKLGKGGFGVVYKGYDEDLRRDVAIKVPHRDLFPLQENAEAYLSEARVLADLDHPNIVPVYDVGRLGDGQCYVVSKFIAGSDLTGKIERARPSAAESASLVATVAEALHYAHHKGLVHRDIKPANILIDTAGKPYVADFGLALREEDFGKGEAAPGTPAYMSPEQARHEGHRVDGRSDVFSLGVVFYELLTGRRPFRGGTRPELLDQIIAVEARPPRQVDDAIPAELERICLKALSKRATERYTTARDFADDLRHFLEDSSLDEGPVVRAAAAAPTRTTAVGPVKVVPKGLRSFDARDADFFLELVPGPRGRAGLPENIRFWKSRIEETDPDQTFAVGLLYGPSGCGKSSLVKAGLLPRLADHVLAVYVETTVDETEARLLKGLRKRCPALPEDLALGEALAALRRGRWLPSGRKVLLVLDQFEQWLHARRGEENTDLVQALRQCDGERVQAVVMVRDDFWMAVTRFMQVLEIDLVPDRNIAAVDLFDLRHAKKVLGAFGRGFGTLAENAAELAKEQDGFLDQAVSGLAQDGKVISVRLALFAEMVKGKPWTPATLREVGGTEGVGVTFLEETFSSPTANPTHRLHQEAARTVLQALLPEQGTDIRGRMRSRGELLEASGYAGRRKDFEELLRILDAELRLITPTDPEGKDEGGRMKDEGKQEGAATASSSSFIHHPSSSRYYQLTHDYLVPALRKWLTRKQRETRRGRADLRLAERAALWAAKPQNRHLPAWWEWANIRVFTRKKDWTLSQRAMMRKAARYQAWRGMALAVLLATLTVIGLTVWGRVIEQRKADYAAGLVRQLRRAETARVPDIVKELDGYRPWADPLLREEYEKAAEGSRWKLHASMALLPVDATQVDYLYKRLLRAGPTELPVIREALGGHRHGLVGRLWKVLDDTGQNANRRFRAACALAGYDTDSADGGGGRWRAVSKFVADQLLVAVEKNPSHYTPLLETLRPVGDRLLGPLADVFRDGERPEAERSFATTILGDYAADRPDVLADLLMDADEEQFAAVYPKLKAQAERGLTHLQAELDKQARHVVSEDAKERLAKRQANAAVALLRMGRPQRVWPLLKHSPDPRARSYLIHRLRALGAGPGAIIERLQEEQEVSIRRALLLSLGEFRAKELSPAERGTVAPRVLKLYQQDPDPGVRGAAEWLLRQWGQQTKLREMDQAWVKDERRRQGGLEQIQGELAKGKGRAQPRWYVNGQGQTMVVIPDPGEFLMGSPRTEAGRDGGPEGTVEMQHRKRIGHSYAIAAHEVTVEQFLRFREDDDYNKQYSPTPDCPVNNVTWYDAAAYCNWLSARAGIRKDQWCYLPNSSGEPFAAGMRLAPDYLHRSGYRLPSEAEWEYACRAGAATSRYYGETEELLGKYAWYAKNSLGRGMLPGKPGTLGVPGDCLKPNDLGLFDMLGNASEWCQEPFYDVLRQRGKPSEDREYVGTVSDKVPRTLRGGSFGYRTVLLRSAFHHGLVPTYRLGDVGFRPARTLR